MPVERVISLFELYDRRDELSLVERTGFERALLYVSQCDNGSKKVVEASVGRALKKYKLTTPSGYLSRLGKQVRDYLSDNPERLDSKPVPRDIAEVDDGGKIVPTFDEDGMMVLPKPNLNIADRTDRRMHWVRSRREYVNKVRESGYPVDDNTLPPELRSSYKPSVVRGVKRSANGSADAGHRRGRHGKGDVRSDGFVYEEAADQSGVPEGHLKCQYCELVLPAMYFPYDKNTGSFRVGSGCRRCKQKNYNRYKKWAFEKTYTDNINDAEDSLLDQKDRWGKPEYKRCGCNFFFGCGNRVLFWTNFKNNKHEMTTLSSYCKDCTREYKRYRREPYNRWNTPLDRGTYV